MSDKKEMGESLLKEYDYPKNPLEAIFDMQKRFGSKFCNFSMYSRVSYSDRTLERRTEWKDTFLDCIFDEVSEVLNWLPWKHWKDYGHYEVNALELRFELIDLLHFVVSECLLIGITPDKVHRYVVGGERASVKITNLEEMVNYAKGKVMTDFRLDPSYMDDKIFITRKLLRTMINLVGDSYGIVTPDIMVSKIMLILFELFGVWDMTGQDIFNYYMSKNQENFDRQERGY